LAVEHARQIKGSHIAGKAESCGWRCEAAIKLCCPAWGKFLVLLLGPWPAVVIATWPEVLDSTTHQCMRNSSIVEPHEFIIIAYVRCRAREANTSHGEDFSSADFASDQKLSTTALLGCSMALPVMFLEKKRHMRVAFIVVMG